MRYNHILGLASILLALTSCSQQRYNDSVVDETYVHKYGVAVSPGFWNQSGQDGSVVSTMSDGVVITRNYQAGQLQGNTSYTFPHSSQIEKVDTYEQGVLVKSTEYYFDGTAKSEIIFNAPGGLRTVSSWYLSGTPRSVEQFNNDRLETANYYTSANQRDAFVENYAGTRLLRDDYGHLLATDTFTNGYMTLRTSYHPNGSPKEQVPYENGQISGLKKTFHPAGEPASIESWVNGVQHGSTVSYLHGDKYAEVPYVNGVKHGTETRYRDGKTVVQEISWNAGQQHGPTTTYVGDNTKTEWYYKGALTTKSDYEFLVNKPVAR